MTAHEFDHRFAKNDHTIINLGYTDSAYWVRFRLKNGSKENNWILDGMVCHLNSPNLDDGDAPYHVDLLSIERIKIFNESIENDTSDDTGAAIADRID